MHTHYPFAQRIFMQAFAVMFAACLHAQPFYTFTRTAEPYSEISGGTPLTFTGGFGQITALNGETFQIMGQPFTFGGARQLWVLDGGALNIDYAPENTVFLSGLFDAFGGLVPMDGTSSVKYLVTGPAGDRQLTVQWKNMHRPDSEPGHYVNFQIVLHQASGVMELRYGVHIGDTTYTAANGPNAGFYFADYYATELYDRIWLSGDPVDPDLSTALTPWFTGLSMMPPAWTVYRFTPTWSIGMAELHDQPDLFSIVTDPGTEACTVRFNGPGIGTLVLYDIQGRILSSAIRSSDSMEIGLAMLPASIYLVEYRTAQGARQVARLIRA